MKIILVSLLPFSFTVCLEKSYSSMEIPGRLTPTDQNCSPLGELKLATHQQIHVSWDQSVMLAISKNAGAHYDEAQKAHADSEKQCHFLNKLFEQTKDQIKYLQDTRKKIKPGQKEQIAQNEIDVYVHQLDACSLHLALMVARGTYIFKQ